MHENSRERLVSADPEFSTRGVIWYVGKHVAYFIFTLGFWILNCSKHSMLAFRVFAAYWATLTPREELFFLLTIYTSEVNCEEEEYEGMIGSINRGDGDWLQDHWQFPTKPFPTKSQKCILYCLLYVCLFANFLMFLHSQDVICSHLFFCW